ncbi:MAG: CotH kinase family protein [Bacteroidales bacterium]|nr:CotH kinase family protein [Bacteroidales bacterium]
MLSILKRAFLFIIILAGALSIHGQWITSSNLPIVIITTDLIPGTNNHYSIQDEPKVPATMKILYVNDSTVNYLSNQNDSAFLNYDGRIGIELRGSTSQGHSKKPYGLETRMDDDVTNRNVSLLGMPAENDWVLTPMNDEPSFVRDCLSYGLAAAMGRYAPRTHYCEVIVNGDYRGLYFLTEKVKIDSKRVDIVSMDSTDNSFPAVSGGFIIKADKLTGGDVPAWTTPAYDYWEEVSYIYHNPKPEEITAAQGMYIQQYFDSIAQLVAANNEDAGSGFPALLDIASFIDYMIMGEMSSNVDIYQKSTFFHKDRCGKLRAGPVWDFNLAYGYDFGSVGRSGYNVLQFDNEDNTGSDFWHQLYENEQYRCYLFNRWKSLTAEDGPLYLYHVYDLIDSLSGIISEAMPRERSRWGRSYDYNNHIATMKTWLANRYAWLDNEFSQVLNCPERAIMPLVISKINYHPPIMQGHASDELEFIGITNNGEDTLDISGVYFRELGLTYQFPAGSFINPHQEIFIASDPDAFLQCYHKNAYGKFHRHLDNKSEALVLADAWGNIIDEVTYADTLPWPTTADGFGDFLILSDLNLDNSQGESWMAADEFVGIDEYGGASFLQVIPNPTTGMVRVVMDKPIRDITVTDISGRVLLTQTSWDYDQELNLSRFPAGVYFLKVVTAEHETRIEKIIKR